MSTDDNIDDSLRELMHVAEIKDGAIVIDGMPLKAVEEYTIHHEHPKTTILTVSMAVVLKGQDNW